MKDGDVKADGSPRDSASGRPAVEDVLNLPLDFEAFYLGHQEFFHAYAEIHLGSRRAAEEVVHQIFLEILAGWDQLLREGDLEQQTLTVLHRSVRRRLEAEGREPAFVINGPIARALRQARDKLELMESSSGLYEAITRLPTRQFTVIVLRHLLGYETSRIARYMGLHERTVDYHGRKAKERLRIQLGLPATRRGRNKKGTAQ
ncbi:sigma-70 family RNA polymerase sigma factor [Streptomyces sp. MST-110588]|uniref:sigma-70 family RNA polymerase sigma factor n=1 Tax=Streptomyces sp. MST-110588 TaxID=2833628 RepID=UPI001F5DD730|nr:sigma-70 family RNA polymerase sigma factor [Streptomyces sp. MST-110588]UNO43527.1 sigma-70 family RNA polymerase sigma factor [Streptomyces sp. MST-110588]